MQAHFSRLTRLVKLLTVRCLIASFVLVGASQFLAGRPQYLSISVQRGGEVAPIISRARHIFVALKTLEIRCAPSKQQFDNGGPSSHLHRLQLVLSFVLVRFVWV